MYVRHKVTGEIFASSHFVKDLPEFEPYSGPLPRTQYHVCEQQAQAEIKEEPSSDIDIRRAAIMRAISEIPREQWGKMCFGRVTLPKVKDVEQLTGIGDISMQEIRDCVGSMEGSP